MNKTTPLKMALAGAALLTCTSASATTYEEWTAGYAFPTGQEYPLLNPDQDHYINALEFVFGTDPLVADVPAAVGPAMEKSGSSQLVVFRQRADLDSSVQTQLERSSTLASDSWVDVPITVSGQPDPENPGVLIYRQPVSPPLEAGQQYFYRLNFDVPFNPELAAKVLVGVQAGDAWNGIPALTDAYIYQINPPVSATDDTPQDSKYPKAVGADQVSFTQNLLSDYTSQRAQPRRRSWMGWFLWGNGTPPPGHSAGYPYKDPSDNSVTPWDFYVWQYVPEQGIDNGSWTPVRIDQQPLYMQPLRLNYNWAPGKFGYLTKPMKAYPGETKFWQDKQIVRGVNLSPNYPFFYQYGDRIDYGSGDTFPDYWRESWLRMQVRPLETLVLVPSVVPPTDILTQETWNNVGTALEPSYQPFPYPVFNSGLQPQQQTPFAILTDKMGDWHADLVWEGSHPGISAYDNYRYRRSDFNQQGRGNYLKMTVAQGSPFVWCELNANQTAPADTDRYMVFYNLIRQNLQDSMNNTTGTNAGTVAGGPWEVPGVTGVSYVLLYGDQTNPNQWTQENGPQFSYLPDPTSDPNDQLPGGFNPPGAQDNHTYFAVFYRTDTVEPLTAANSGTDAQGNPYFYLKFAEDGFNGTGKNWFVVGQVPVMRYYHTGVTRDAKAVLDQAARDWADQMGKYAFNFLTDTDVRYSVTNMYKVTTHFDAAFQNPFVAAGDPSASAMVADDSKSVMALFPHHYQPFTLGPDLTSSSHEEVVWNPLKTTGIDFPAVAGPPNANKSEPGAPSLWDYWHPRGNLKSVITGSFTTEYLFQNFLPAMPEPKWEENYEQTGIQVVLLSDVDGYTRVTDEPTATLTDLRPGGQGAGAEFKVLLEPNTGRILQVDVVSPGSGYPVGNPPLASEAQFTISAPTLPGGTQAQARIQTDGNGSVLAVFMNDKGSGYRSTVQITQPSNPKVDPAIVVPAFDSGNNVIAGPARVISGGSGYDFNAPISAELIGNGSGAQVQVVKPGEVYGITRTSIGGFDNAGLYPLVHDSLSATADNIRVEVPPPSGGGTTPQVELTMAPTNNLFGILIEDPGEYTVQPTGAYYMNDEDVRINCTISYFAEGKVLKIDLAPEQSSALSTRKQIQFEGGSAVTPCIAYAYPGASIADITLAGGASTAVYDQPVELVVTGGSIGPGTGTDTFEMPEFDWSVNAAGKLVLNGFKNGNNGSGFWGPALFQVRGGRGHDAATRVNVAGDGSIASIDVIRPGSNYPVTPGAVGAAINSTGAGATFQVNVAPDGSLASIDVLTGGSGYSAPEVLELIDAVRGGTSTDASPPRGYYAEIYAIADGSGGLENPFIRNDSGPQEQAGYLPDSDGETSDATGRLYLKYFDVENRQVLSPLSQGQGFVTAAVPTQINVEQLFYDNIIGDYTTSMSDALRPFGGAFGGRSAPDGYGLGNQLSATTKSVNVLYHLQQHYASEDQPSVTPSNWAFIEGSTIFKAEAPYTYERDLPILREHNPLFTLSGALQSSVQMMQRTLSLLHQDPVYHNNPTEDMEEGAISQTWKMDYFSLYDTDVGRMLINPTATIPVYGVVSSIHNPPANPPDNAGKTGLNEWKPGKLWSGFGVSDQWNDQHYFFGYYLGVAGWAAIFDRTWDASLTAKPSDLWASEGQMGTALEQWYLSVAYDPDNSALLNDIYEVGEFTYQKLPFFDQWTGHGWATGIPPGPAGLRDPDTPWSVAVSSGTGNFGFGDENENSTWEGLQAYSAAILWGAGTDRKPLVDVGLYMLATGMTASDLYFQDKNYNLSDNPTLNTYSWVPVTTVASSTIPNNGGNNSYPANSSYNDGAHEAFYMSEPYFGGEASPGISLYRKYGPTLNNFFYAYPTGSKFILAYPPTAWTLGISRNSDYMRKWAGAMMREEWREARDSALYQPGNWLGMAMTSALSGVPYNPGDEPLNEAGTALDPNGPDPYVDRLWASWASLDGGAGREASRQPAFTATSTLHFLHALDAYGTPDWTYLGRATNSSGSDDDGSILMMASFSKLNESGDAVETTFVAFNPGWETRYAVFDRLGSDGSVSTQNASGLMTVPPKKMISVTKTFTIE
ncbi:hypothetical protein H5P28_13390 [Ruficoccus amylovorans]|uniref:Glycosyl hydrolase family 81 n=1 Tax=Ruficoccus amylovorans TaxID=1804625 RepID=A0A842HI40_9BACT|nr:hypothetical protein [Ruficoccus amylovorans]MBC2595256.1 hypothetical protein [Ruficoccus amylovorans]